VEYAGTDWAAAISTSWLLEALRVRRKSGKIKVEAQSADPQAHEARREE
jgi:hypothetical protein